jgi:thiamine biosynthesis lipoprotein
MTIPYSIQIGDPINEQQELEILALIERTFSEIDQIYNNWNPESEISQLNALKAHETVPISSELYLFLQKVGTLVQTTEGRFDPTVEPLCQLWKTALQSGSLPDPEKIATCRAAVGWHLLHFENRCFWKEHSLTACNFGGVAKGYGVDLLVERLQDAGYRHLFVEWGGEVRSTGDHPQGRPWKVAIIGLYPIDLSDQAIATSGSYIQHWEVDGITYTHIINPQTLQPLNPSPITSSSVIASSCCEADALATAGMLFPTQEAALQWAEAKNIQLLLW